MNKRNPIPKDLNVTVTMSARQMRAVIDAADLTGGSTGLDDASHGVLRLMSALQQAETIHDAEVSA